MHEAGFVPNPTLAMAHAARRKRRPFATPGEAWTSAAAQAESAGRHRATRAIMRLCQMCQWAMAVTLDEGYH
jgi:hypothetical protein